jgi:methyl-accepting chemotaxis protein
MRNLFINTKLKGLKMTFSDISFKNKVFIMLSLPMIGFIWMSIAAILDSIEINSEIEKSSELIRLSVNYSQLVHELQKERGMTAGFLGSKGKKFSIEIKSQRNDVDSKVTLKNKFLDANNISDTNILQLNNEISRELNKLSSIRQQVNSFSISLGSALGYYTQLNAKLLSVSPLIVALSSDQQITQNSLVYYNFLQGKERAGIERAVLSNTFSRNQFGPGIFVKFVALISEQSTYFSNFMAFTNPVNKQFFTDQLSDNAVKEVLRLREIAKSKSSDFNVDALYWFQQSTARIGQLKKIENQLSDNLLAIVSQKQNDASNAMIFNLVFSVILIFCAVIISFITIKDLSARVLELTTILTRVSNNNDLSVSATFEGKSELGQIATALNLTLGTFSSTIAKISAASNTLSCAVKETSITCESNSTSLSGQLDNLGSISTAVEELSLTVTDVAKNTQLTANSAKDAQNQVENGLAVVQKSYQSTTSLAEDVQRLAKQISHLNEDSTKITTVIDVIKSVAKQTNLLALNAAIEAARAGDQGRGFAVVADEVRTLAQRTQKSTEDIGEFIDSLQNKVTTAFAVIEESQLKATNAVANSKEVENSLNGISGSVNKIFKMTEQIATALEEQSVVTTNIAENIVSIENQSKETTAGASQIAATSKQQALLANNLKSIAGTFTYK